MRLEFIPKDTVQDHPEKGKHIALHQISLHPLSLRRTYGVTLRFHHQTPIQIQYKIDLICCKRDGDNNYHIEIQKQDMYINKKSLSSSIDLLMQACGKVLYPLVIKVNKKCEFIGIVNHTAICNRWATLKTELQQSHTGQYARSLIEETSKTLSNVSTIERSLCTNDWFYNLFFNALKGNAYQERFPIVPYQKGVLYDIKTSAYYHKTRTKDIVITKKGVCTDTRNEQDIKQGNLSLGTNSTPPIGSCDIAYHVFEGTNLIDAIIGEFSLDYPSGNKEKVGIEICNLKHEIPQTTQEKQLEKDRVMQQEIAEKKHKKKYFLFGKEIKF